MRIPPLLADFSHARACKPFCEKYLTLPGAPSPCINLSPAKRIRRDVKMLPAPAGKPSPAKDRERFDHIFSRRAVWNT